MQVAVLGGGYAGVVAVSRLETRLPDDVDLVLVDPREAHVIRHELHRVIRRPGFAETIQVPFDTILDRAEHRQARVEALDPVSGIATLAEGGELAYDAAVVGYGAAPADYGLEGVLTNGIPLDTPADALAISEELTAILEDGRSDPGNIVVGGGGLAGVQAAGELIEATRDGGAEEVSVTLLEQEGGIAPRFGETFADRIRAALVSLGVRIMTDTSVSAVTPESVTLGDATSLPADLFVWAGGIKGQPPFEGERPRVRADLRLGDSTFGAGDAVQVIDVDGAAVQPSAQSAIRTGKVASENVARVIEARQRGESGRPRLKRYRDETYAWVVSVGDKAVAKVGPQVLTGRPAKALKSTVGVGYLSSAGALREAVALVREEFGFGAPLP